MKNDTHPLILALQKLRTEMNKMPELDAPQAQSAPQAPEKPMLVTTQESHA